MAKKTFTDREIKVKILYKLRRKRAWGGKYVPYRSVVSRVESMIKRNGKRVKRIVDELVKDRWLLAKKGGDTLSLNPRRKREIIRIIEEYFDRKKYT